MDVYKQCPKCNREGLEPAYHKGPCPKKRKGWNNTSLKEHLHYVCKCGFDFVKLIKR